MKLIKTLEELKNARLQPSAAALGTFDGVHLGHQDVIGTTRKYAKQHHLQLMVFTFSNHPLAFLKPEKAPVRLMDNEEKIKMMVDLGVDILVNLPFTQEFSQIPAEDFLQLLVQSGVKAVGIGDNYSFGAGGKGNLHLLKKEHSRFGLTVLARPLLKVEGRVVSSSNIRQLIKEGKMALARKMLGRPYTIRGTVVKGDQRGRLLGFPTANLRILGRNIALPPFGVYAGKVRVEQNVYDAMINIGDNPTFLQQETRLEAHLLDFTGDLYGKTIQVGLWDYVRGEKKFASSKELITQLVADRDTVQELLKNE